LLQNAFKFTHSGSEVLLKVYALAERILIEVEDKCGGLPPGDAETMFLPFAQSGADRSGLGLSRPLGCVFTIDLPRHGMSDGA
jgi:signal transduction histidine kinase